MTTASSLIARSISHTEIAHADWTADLASDLLAECEDNVEASKTVHEFWGTDEDGAEWRVHLDGPRDHVNCECGEWSGERCEWHGPKADTVVVEYMPEQHRASHTAAKNAGTYPANGARSIRVERSCADRMVEHDAEWVTVR